MIASSAANYLARQPLAALLAVPEQYKTGTAKFCELEFAVDRRVLIPRFETEYLVKETVRWCTAHDPQRAWTIADIGTGSGAIAVSLAANLPQVRIIASDISADALELAACNADMHGVTDRIQFVHGSLLEPLSETPDIIVANLPYISSARIPLLDPSVRDWEPHIALDGGKDGFDLYRQLLDEIGKRDNREPNKLRLTLFEIDNGQEFMAQQEIIRRLPHISYAILKDTSGLIRYVKIEMVS